jgi:SAM-dependent methyltransferase
LNAIPLGDDAVRTGWYAARQIYGGDRLVAWSHRRRFATALGLARAISGRRLLDYGCGDGTFLALLDASGCRPTEAVGAEIDDAFVVDCQRRFARCPTLSFVHADGLDTDHYRSRYDVIFCMEVLEHVVDVDGVIDRLWRLLGEAGTLVVSVPVETGLPLLAKQAARRVAGWRGICGYPGTASYTWRECCAGVFAGSRPHLSRSAHGGNPPLYDHKGFNWMALRDRLARRFAIGRVVASPFDVLGPHLATQVWFVAKKAARPCGLHPL